MHDARTRIATLTPAEFMKSCDRSVEDVEIFYQLMEATLDRLTQLCDEEKDPIKFREGVIDLLMKLDTQPVEH
jgi:CRISPR/Cas system CSM-associated protein Csm2 small subunit